MCRSPRKSFAATRYDSSPGGRHRSILGWRAPRRGIRGCIVLSKIGLALAAVGAALVPRLTLAQDAVDLRLVGHDDLQARSAYQPIVHAYGERRILFFGPHGGGGGNPTPGT